MMVSHELATDTTFLKLCLGLLSYTEEDGYKKDWPYPPGLMLAMNDLSLHMEDKFPKTWREFIAYCEKPLAVWYPNSVTVEHFGGEYQLLKAGRLTEQAQDFLNELPITLLTEQEWRGYVPQSVLDNQVLADLIHRLHGEEDQTAAQQEYVTVRSFLIEHCWIGRRAERTLNQSGLKKERIDWIKKSFYRIGHGDLWECDRCGVLRMEGDRLIGIKPDYCDDHREGLPHIRQIQEYSFLQLNNGTHLRTFIPGRAELAIFEEAERLNDEYPDCIFGVERYPSLDSYDLRVQFSDEVWAVDVKDIADPETMAKKVKPLDNDGALTHQQGFYVIPDRRLIQQPDYLTNVRRRTAAIKPPLISLISQTEFCDRMQTKCKSLLKKRR